MRRIHLVALVSLSLVAASCGGSNISESIVLPEGFTTTTEVEGQAPTETAGTEPQVPFTTETPDEAGEAAIQPAGIPVSPDATVPPAISESGRAPAYGGGNPTTSLTDALSVSMPAVFGPEVDVSQFLGQDVVLWFWAPWCSWCNAEAPRVNSMAAEYGDQVEIVGVAGVSEIEEMQGFVERHGLRELTHLADLDSHFWLSLDVTYQPWWIFINDTGEVVLNWQGRLTEDEIREVMDVLVAA